MVLLALAESKPDSPRAAAAAESLLRFHGCFGYHTGRARGAAVAALSSWFGLGKEQATDLEIAVQVNGKEIGIVKSTAIQRTEPAGGPADAIKPGKNLVEFKARGRGRYTYAADLFGFSSDTKEQRRPSRHQPLAASARAARIPWQAHLTPPAPLR